MQECSNKNNRNIFTKCTDLKSKKKKKKPKTNNNKTDLNDLISFVKPEGF